MSELRKDPVTGDWVIISPERARRPTDFVKEAANVPGSPGACPFCPGNESMTPPEVLTLPERTPADGAGWQVRVVPNKFPAVEAVKAPSGSAGGLFERLDGLGAHEVIIETPDHGATLAALPESAIESVLQAYQARARELQSDKRFPYVLIFKNHGSEAGATLEHGHSQLIALPLVPRRVQEELEGARAYFSRRGRCVYCEIIEKERAAGKRVVLENEDFIALAPYASRFPWEILLLPRRHRSRFEEASESERASLARALKGALAALNKRLSNPPYNLVVHSAPHGEASDDDYHWHVEVMPSLSRVGGFEWGTGVHINSIPPEEVARNLRELKDLRPGDRSPKAKPEDA